MERKITFKGSPLTLMGRALRIGMRAPAFRVVNGELKEAGLSDFTGRTKVITSFPSLDTPVCDLQLKAFNAKAGSLGAGVSVIGISKDLPFAQKRFCEMNRIKDVTVLSDYRYSSFGINYGLLIKELNLLARAVLVLDRYDALRYVQLVSELTQPPDYDAALKAVEAALRVAAAPVEDLLSRCAPCEGGVPALGEDEVSRQCAAIPAWQVVDGVKITREFRFKDSREANYALNLVAAMAEEQGHHPAILLAYNKLRFTLTTHAAGGLTRNDFVMARIIDEILS